MIRRVLAVAFAAAALFPQATLADVGPRADVAAIRHDLPILLAARVRDWGRDPEKDVRIEVVAVSGDDALAQWRVGSTWGVEGLMRIYGRWWDRMTANTSVLTAPPLRLTNICIQVDGPYVLSRSALLDLGWPAAIVSIADALPAVRADDRALASVAPTPTPSGSSSCSVYSIANHTISATGGSVSEDYGGNNRYVTDGYVLDVTYAPNTALPGSRVDKVFGRRPSSTEAALTLAGGAEFFFGATLVSASQVRFRPGTSVKVWFPFVLDTRVVHGLTIGGVISPFDPIAGTLRDNTLRFDLPSFSVAPGAHITGAIDAAAL